MSPNILPQVQRPPQRLYAPRLFRASAMRYTCHDETLKAQAKVRKRHEYLDEIDIIHCNTTLELRRLSYEELKFYCPTDTDEAKATYEFLEKEKLDHFFIEMLGTQQRSNLNYEKTSNVLVTDNFFVHWQKDVIRIHFAEQFTLKGVPNFKFGFRVKYPYCQNPSYRITFHYTVYQPALVPFTQAQLKEAKAEALRETKGDFRQDDEQGGF